MHRNVIKNQKMIEKWAKDIIFERLITEKRFFMLAEILKSHLPFTLSVLLAKVMIKIVNVIESLMAFRHPYTILYFVIYLFSRSPLMMFMWF